MDMFRMAMLDENLVPYLKKRKFVAKGDIIHHGGDVINPP